MKKIIYALLEMMSDLMIFSVGAMVILGYPFSRTKEVIIGSMIIFLYVIIKRYRAKNKSLNDHIRFLKFGF